MFAWLVAVFCFSRVQAQPANGQTVTIFPASEEIVLPSKINTTYTFYDSGTNIISPGPPYFTYKVTYTALPSGNAPNATFAPSYSQVLPVGLVTLTFTANAGTTLGEYKFKVEICSNNLGCFRYSNEVKLLISRPNGPKWTLAASDSKLQRVSPAVLVFKDKLWVLGGCGYRFITQGPVDCDKNPLQTIANSNNGMSWFQVGFLPRHSCYNPTSPGLYDQSIVVFNGKLWSIGGLIPYAQSGVPGPNCSGNPTNEIFSSIDGANWQSVGSLPVPRAKATAIVDPATGELVLIGGFSCLGANCFNQTVDDLRTSDGVTWVRSTSRTAGIYKVVAYNSRLQIVPSVAPVVYNGQIWNLGGTDPRVSSTALSVVSRTTDGVSWIDERPSSHPYGYWYRQFIAQFNRNAQGYLAPGSYGVTCFRNQMWVIGGALNVDPPFPPVGYQSVEILPRAWSSAEVGSGCGLGQFGKTGPAQLRNDNSLQTYQINYTIPANAGQLVSIKDVLPVNIEYQGLISGPSGVTVRQNGQEIYFENIPRAPPQGSIAFKVIFRPSNFATDCTTPRVNNQVEMYGFPTVPVAGAPILTLSSGPTSEVECYSIKKVVTSPTVFPVEPGTRVDFKLEYTARGSSPSFPTQFRITDIGQGFDITGVQPSQGTVTGPSGNSFNIDNLPSGVQQIVTYGMPVKEEACTTPPAVNRSTLQVGGNPTSQVSVSLLCRLKISGDIGAGNAANVIIDPIKVLGPAIVVAGQTVNESGAGVIEPSARRLSTYNLPLLNNGWLDQFNKINNRLLKEFATTQPGPLQNTTVTISNPLRIIKYTSSGTVHIRSVIFQSTVAGGQTGTVIVPSANRIQIDADISASNGPLAIVVDNGAPIELTGTNDITIGSSGNPVALVAPNSVVDFGTSRRKINLTGLIVARSITNLSVPYGTIKFDKTLVEKPPPGLGQLLSLVIAEQAP